MYALNLADDGRILSATYPQFAPVDAVIVDTLPSGDISDYIYENRDFLYLPLPVSDPEPDTSSGSGDVWDELDEAYAAGYNEGYQKGVNEAYDQ